MSRSLFLHCGPAKTGTSAIQAVLRDTPPPGVFYPRTGQWTDGAHHKLLFAMRGKTSRGTISIPPFATLLTALCAELDAVDTDVVISSEAFNTADIETFLNHLNNGLSRPFDQIRAIVVLRHPLERAASAYNQNIKDLAVTAVQMPKPYLETHGPNLCLTSTVRAWQNVPLQVTFLNYHPPATLVNRFFETIGHLPENGPLSQETHNRSINGYGLITLLAGRMIGLSPDNLKDLFKALRQDKTRTIWQGPSFPFARNSCIDYLKTHVAPDLIQVERLTGLTLPDMSDDIPKRFQISDDDMTCIRGKISAFAPDHSQTRRLDAVLTAFAMQKRTPL